MTVSKNGRVRPGSVLALLFALSLSSWIGAAPARAGDPAPDAEAPSATSTPVVAEVGVARRVADDGSETVIGYVRRGAGPGKPALIVLGGPYSVEWFGRWLEPLYDVVYLVAPPTSLLMSQQVADVEAVRQHLELETVAIFGHSHDGAVALEYAASHPEAVTRVIWVAGLCDQQHSIRLGLELLSERVESDGEKQTFQGLAAQEQFDALDLAAHLRARELGPSCLKAETCRHLFTRAGAAVDAAGYMARLAELAPPQMPSPDGMAAAALTPDVRGRSLVGYRSLDAAPALENIPFLMVQGDADLTVHPDTAHALSEALAQADYVLFEQTGHMPFLEDAERFIALVQGFLEIDAAVSPTPSVLADDWRPPYDTGEFSAEELDQQAADMFAAGVAEHAAVMLGGGCQIVSSAPAEELAPMLQTTAAEIVAFQEAFCSELPDFPDQAPAEVPAETTPEEP